MREGLGAQLTYFPALQITLLAEITRLNRELSQEQAQGQPLPGGRGWPGAESMPWWGAMPATARTVL